MRLLYACWLNHATADLPLFSAEAWQRRGHEVYLFPYDLEFSNLAGASVVDSLAMQDKDLRQAVFLRRLRRCCERLQPDALMLAFPFVSPSALRLLRRTYGLCIGFSLGFNNLLEEEVAESIAISDFVLVHDSYLVPVLKGTGRGRCPCVVHFGAAANPSEHRPLALSDWDAAHYGADVGFIGGYSQNRAAAFIPLSRYKLRIWGVPSWNHVPQLAAFCSAEPVYGIKKVKIYNACKIIVNLEDDEKNINSLSCRVPEVLACGGFVISQRSHDLDATGLKDGESVATFSSSAELADKVSFYLAHPDERRRISDNGRRRVLDSMTYDVAYGSILDRVEACLAGHP